MGQTKTSIPGSLFTNGGTVNFALGSTPSAWGTGPNDAPPTYDATPGPGTPPSGNLAPNRPATGSTAGNAKETPAKAVNGSVSGGLSDKWCSLAAARFLQVLQVQQGSGTGGAARSCEFEAYS